MAHFGSWILFSVPLEGNLCLCMKIKGISAAGCWNSMDVSNTNQLFLAAYPGQSYYWCKIRVIRVLQYTCFSVVWWGKERNEGNKFWAHAKWMASGALRQEGSGWIRQLGSRAVCSGQHPAMSQLLSKPVLAPWTSLGRRLCGAAAFRLPADGSNSFAFSD